MSLAEQELTPQDMVGMRIEDIPAVFGTVTLAKILLVSDDTAAKIMNRPDFPVFRMSSKTWRIYKVPFLNWLEEQCQPLNRRG